MVPSNLKKPKKVMSFQKFKGKKKKEERTGCFLKSGWFSQEALLRSFKKDTGSIVLRKRFRKKKQTNVKTFIENLGSFKKKLHERMKICSEETFQKHPHLGNGKPVNPCTENMEE